MKFSLYSRYGALNSRPVFEALARSIVRKGWQISDHDDSADVAVIWSVLWDGRMKPNQQIWQMYRTTSRHVLVLEIGALDRGNLWKVALNGINGSGYFGPLNNSDSRQKQLNLRLDSWRTGKNIVLCGQHPHSQQWEGQPAMNQWMDETISTVRRYTDRHIIVRPHPRAKYVPTRVYKNVSIGSPKSVPNTYDSFDFELSINDAWAVINWNSNPAVIAALRGVPVFVGPNSMAASVGNDQLANIENPMMPDRQQWARDVAYTEWSVEEIARGIPLERLSDKLTS